MPVFSHVLKVTLSHATELAQGDYLGKSDPYVTLAIDSDKQQHARSSGRAGTLSPEWNPPERFDFKLMDPLTQTLLVQVWDHDLILSDDLLGSVSIPLKDFDAQETAPTVGYALRKSGKVTGCLFLQISVTPLDKHEITLELWENEWYSFTAGWNSGESNLFQHRLRWSNEDGSVSHKDFAQVAPKPPLHFSSPGWDFCVGKGDVNGWLYATTFAGPWYPESSPTTVVRRRKWTSICRRPGSSKALAKHMITF